MTFSVQDLRDLVKEALQERQWNKDSNTPRDYDKEYNPPGSKEQDDRNKRKRDKRKHDREHGECPEGEELHHVNGIKEDEVECEPVSKNRGRKGEGGRISKDIKIKITEEQIRQIIQEESVEVINEVFPWLADMALKGAMGAGKAVGDGATGLGKLAYKGAKGAAEWAMDTGPEKAAAAKVKQMKIKNFKEIGAIINALMQQAADEGGLEGDPKELEQALAASAQQLHMLKKSHGGDEQ